MEAVYQNKNERSLHLIKRETQGPMKNLSGLSYFSPSQYTEE